MGGSAGVFCILLLFCCYKGYCRKKRVRRERLALYDVHEYDNFENVSVSVVDESIQSDTRLNKYTRTGQNIPTASAVQWDSTSNPIHTSNQITSTSAATGYSREQNNLQPSPISQKLLNAYNNNNEPHTATIQSPLLPQTADQTGSGSKISPPSTTTTTDNRRKKSSPVLDISNTSPYFDRSIIQSPDSQSAPQPPTTISPPISTHTHPTTRNTTITYMNTNNNDESSNMAGYHRKSEDVYEIDRLVQIYPSEDTTPVTSANITSTDVHMRSTASFHTDIPSTLDTTATTTTVEPLEVAVDTGSSVNHAQVAVDIVAKQPVEENGEVANISGDVVPVRHSVPLTGAATNTAITTAESVSFGIGEVPTTAALSLDSEIDQAMHHRRQQGQTNLRRYSATLTSDISPQHATKPANSSPGPTRSITSTPPEINTSSPTRRNSSTTRRSGSASRRTDSMAITKAILGNDTETYVHQAKTLPIHTFSPPTPAPAESEDTSEEGQSGTGPTKALVSPYISPKKSILANSKANILSPNRGWNSSTNAASARKVASPVGYTSLCQLSSSSSASPRFGPGPTLSTDGGGGEGDDRSVTSTSSANSSVARRSGVVRVTPKKSIVDIVDYEKVRW